MNRACYVLLKKIVAPLFFSLCYRIRVHGKDTIPEKGPVILSGNHASYLDPMLLFHIAPRPFYAVTARFLFNIRWLGWALRALGCIPTGGNAVGGALSALRGNSAILIFPEGGCHCTPEKMSHKIHRGVAVFALKTGAPVIPIAIQGTAHAWPPSRLFPRLFKTLTVRIGPPLRFPAHDEDTLDETLLAHTLTRIMDAISELYAKE